MAARSTRNKMKRNLELAAIKLEGINGQLDYIETLSEGRIELITKMIPAFKFVLAELKENFDDLRSRI